MCRWRHHASWGRAAIKTCPAVRKEIAQLATSGRIEIPEPLKPPDEDVLWQPFFVLLLRL